MTITLHPSKENPERYRVYVGRLNVQKYFSFKTYGSQEKALIAAQKYLQGLDNKLKTLDLISQLDIHKVFNTDGSVIGLKRIKRIRKVGKDYEALRFQARVETNVPCTIEVSLSNRPFEKAYKLMQSKILSARKIEKSLDIITMFKQAKRMYW